MITKGGSLVSDPTAEHLRTTSIDLRPTETEVQIIGGGAGEDLADAMLQANSGVFHGEIKDTALLNIGGAEHQAAFGDFDRQMQSEAGFSGLGFAGQ